MTDAPDPSRTVLVIEDEALVAMLVEHILGEAGYRTAWVPDGRGTAPAAAGSAAPTAGAAVLDLRLAQGLDGRDVLRRLRQQQPGMPVVVITGFDPLAPEADLRGLGGPTTRLGKPFVPHALLEGLAGVLASSAAPATPRRRASDVPEKAAA